MYVSSKAGFPEKLPPEALLTDPENLRICWEGCQAAVGPLRLRADRSALRERVELLHVDPLRVESASRRGPTRHAQAGAPHASMSATRGSKRRRSSASDVAIA